MNSLNPLIPPKKYRITYRHRIWYANVVDFSPASGVLTVDGITTMIFNPDELRISLTDDIRVEPDSARERSRYGGIKL